MDCRGRHNPLYYVDGIHYNDGVSDTQSITFRSQMKVHKNDYAPATHDDALIIDLKDLLKGEMLAFISKKAADAGHKAKLIDKLTTDGVNVGGA